MSEFGKIAGKLVTSSDRVETLRRRSSALTRLVNAVETKIRVLENTGREFADIRSFDGSEKLTSCIRQNPSIWSNVALAGCETPGMLTPEECQYYTYIGRFFSGAGEIVELGPWLGRSTFYIVQGLSKNPRFTKKIHVYDDFVWRSPWMDPRVPTHERIPHHGDFQPLFEKYSRALEEHVQVQKRKIVDFDGNNDVEQLVWDGSRVEFIYVDCGRTYEANESWWKVFSGSFIPNKTLIFLEDWSTHLGIPVQWYNQIKEWVDSKAATLQLVHELEHGGVATFLYKG